MATKSIVGRVRSTQLEQSLSGTIVADYVPQIDSNFMSLLQNKGDNIMIPSLGYFMSDIAPESKNRFINLYNRTMGLEDGVENIPDEVKAVQGALFDGLCFGYDTTNDTVAIYTMNFDLLMNDLDVNRDMASMCIKSNLVGQFKGFRIDVEYEVGPETFNFKAVNHRKVLDDETVILIPYIACVRLMKMIESFLASGAVLKVKQDFNGLEKLRYVTRNESVLAKYCDTPSAVRGLEPSFFPLKAFFYAPVLGAPSTTAMVTNINLFNLCEIKKIKADKVANLGISKPADPMRAIIEDRVFSSTLYSLIVDNPQVAADIVTRLPKGTEFFASAENVSDISTAAFSKYMHGLTDEEREMAVDAVPNVREEIDTRMKVLGGGTGEVIEPDKFYDLRPILKDHVCRFIIRKKDCSLSSMIGTNNRNILAGIYGEDYFKNYESFGVRLYEVFDEVDLGREIKDALEANGFESSPEICSELMDLYTENGRTVTDKVRFGAAEMLGYKTRTSSSGDSDSIMFRTLDATVTENGVQGYYRNVDPDKIVSALILK